ncbi:UNKNOWN [Stylonychia lemnae]|uniref:Uncharacterized protein n=1 Tax=Stylonychia lemnae TaxID=5949 RepID=A0A078AEL9_STYLE|nr:UNKNOWN [Stylonychia lemnae]|eukprot:CDW79917.1 UNKNOWN [Stylonychia lemnae]
MLVIVSYFIYSINDVLSYQYTLTSSSQLNDLLRDDVIYNVKDSMDMATQVIYTGPDESVAENIDLYFSIYFQILQRDGKSKHGISNYTLFQEYHFEECKEGRFGTLGAAAHYRGIYDYYMCPITTDFFVQGDFGSKIQKSLVLIVDYCNQTFLDLQSPGKGRICKSIQEIDQVIPFSILYHHNKQLQFDQNDFTSNPVKSTLFETPFNLNTGISTAYFYKITKTRVTLKDYLLSNSMNQQEIEYYNYYEQQNENMQFKYLPNDKKLGSAYLPNGWPLISVFHLVDPYVKIQERLRFSLLDALSKTGGFAGVISLIFMILSRLIKFGTYEEALISQLYLTKQQTLNRKIKIGGLSNNQILNQSDSMNSPPPSSKDQSSSQIELDLGVCSQV